jgi:hypothetical protein
MRRLFSILSAVFLLACVVFWIRSYWRQEWAGLIFPDKRATSISTIGGGFYLTTAAPWPGSHLVGSMPISEGDLKFYQAQALIGGFGCGYRTLGPIRMYSLAMPFWFVTLLAAMLFGFALYRSNRRPPPGFCRQCGYDLRASPERCPECGTAVPKPNRP